MLSTIDSATIVNDETMIEVRESKFVEKDNPDLLSEYV